MAANEEGVVVCEGAGVDYIRMYDHGGKYLRTVYPFPAAKLAEVKGLDECCQVGQGGMFYLSRKDGGTKVSTWTGTEVSSDVTVRASIVTFRRGGKMFRGRKRGGEDCFSFERII